MKQITPLRDAHHASLGRASDGRDSRWDAHRTQRRDELVLAARRAIHRGGPGVAMGDIALEAATSKSVYYRYFGDKDGLRRAIGDDVIVRLSAAIESAGRSAPSAQAALTAMIATYLAQAEASPNTYAFVMAPGETGAQDAVEHVSSRLATLFGERLAQLSPQLPHVTTHLWPQAALGFIRSAGESWLTLDKAGRPSAPQLAEQLTQWLLSGPLATAEQPSGPQSPRKDQS